MRIFFLFYIVLFLAIYSFSSSAGIKTDSDSDNLELEYGQEYNKDKHFPPIAIEYFLENYEYINIKEKKEQKTESILSAYHVSCFLIAGIKCGIINYAYHIPPQKLTDEEKFDHLMKDFDHKTQKENGLQQVIFYNDPEDLTKLKKKFENKELSFRPDREISFEKYINPMSIAILGEGGDCAHIHINSKENIYHLYEGVRDRIVSNYSIESGAIFEE